MSGLTTDDHTCVQLLDDVVLRQVLATRDSDGRAMLVRLNLAANGVGGYAGRLIGRADPARPHTGPTGPTGPTATDRSRHPSAGRHAAAETPVEAPRHSAAA